MASVCSRRVPGGVSTEAQSGGIGLRKELGAVVELGEDQHHDDEESERPPRTAAVAERPGQRLAIEDQDPAADTGILRQAGRVIDRDGALRVGPHVGCRQRRIGGEGDDERRGEGDADGDGQDRHEVADDAGPEKSGTKAPIVVRVELSTAAPTSRVPSCAASKADLPSCMWR